MAELREIAKLVRSKNAGPWELTIDIMFDDLAAYGRAAAGPLGSDKTYARIYHLDACQVRVYLHPAALAIKVSMPRPWPAGGLEETDVFGGQLHSPLLRLEIDEANDLPAGGTR